MTPDGVIVAAVLAVVLVSMSSVGITTALRVAGVMDVLDVLGDLLGPVTRRGQIIKQAVGEVWEGGEENDG